MILRRPRRLELTALTAVALLAVVALLVLKLVSEVRKGETLARDAAILRWLRSLIDGGSTTASVLRQFMLDVTAFGDTGNLVLVVLAAAGWCLVRREPVEASFVAATTASGGGVIALTRHWVGRMRPDVVPALVQTHSASFPSGHAANRR